MYESRALVAHASTMGRGAGVRDAENVGTREVLGSAIRPAATRSTVRHKYNFLLKKHTPFIPPMIEVHIIKNAPDISAQHYREYLIQRKTPVM